MALHECRLALAVCIYIRLEKKPPRPRRPRGEHSPRRIAWGNANPPLIGTTWALANCKDCTDGALYISARAQAPPSCRPNQILLHADESLILRQGVKFLRWVPAWLKNHFSADERDLAPVKQNIIYKVCWGVSGCEVFDKEVSCLLVQILHLSTVVWPPEMTYILPFRRRRGVE